MSEDQVIILLFRIVVLADIVAISVFVAVYTKLARWWHDPIGRTIVIKSTLLLLLLIPSALSLFFHFNRLSSHIAAWIDLALLAAVGVVMTARTRLWLKIVRKREPE